MPEVRVFPRRRPCEHLLRDLVRALAPRALHRRGGPRRDPGAALLALLLVAVVVATIGRPLVGIGSLHAADTLRLLDPWAQEAEAGFRPDNGTVSDTVDAVAPVRMAIASRAREGDLALWSSTQAGGAPLLGVPNTAMLSPLNLPWWIAPAHWAPALAKALQMLVAAVGTVLFLRRLGLSRAAALVGALGFVNAGHLVVWTTWPQSNVAALVPLLFWAVDRAVASPRWVDAWPVPLVGAVLWLEGFPALALWAHVLAGAWAAFRAWRPPPPGGVGVEVAGSRDQGTHTLDAAIAGGEVPKSRRQDTRNGGGGAGRSSRVWRVVAVAGAMLVGLGVAAVQLVPFAFRMAELDTSSRATKAANALPWETMATLAVPDALGAAGRGVWFGPRNEVEAQAFVGVVVLVLAVAALVGNRRLADAARTWVAFAAAASLVVGAMIWLGGPFHDAVQSLPLVGGNQTGRLRGLLAFLLAGAAGAGFEVLLRAAPSRFVRLRAAGAVTSPARLLLRIGAGVAIVVATLVPALLEAGELAEAAGRGDFLAEALRDAGVVLAASLLAVAGALLLRGRRRRAVALAAIPLLLVVQSTAFARDFLPRIDADDFYPRTVAHDVVADLVGSDRFAVGGLALYPGTTTAYGLRSVTAHAAVPPAWKALLLEADPTAFDRNATFPILAPGVEVASSPVLDLLGASHFVTSTGDPLLGVRADGEVVEGTLVPPGAPLHGVDVHRDVLRALDDHDLPARLVAWVEDEAGKRTALGERRLTGREVGDWLPVALAPPRPGGPSPVEGRVVVAIEVGELGITVAPPARLRVRPVRVGPEGLRVVAAPGVVVYERPDARPRIRLESPSVDRVEVGMVEVVEDRDDELRVLVDVPAGGATLVVADAVSGGHLARVDGEPVEVVAAHEALVGVPVPEGSHEVLLTWHPEGIRPAAALTVVSLLGIHAAALVAARRRVASDEVVVGEDGEQLVGAVGEGVAGEDGGAPAA